MSLYYLCILYKIGVIAILILEMDTEMNIRFEVFCEPVGEQ